MLAILQFLLLFSPCAEADVYSFPDRDIHISLESGSNNYDLNLEDDSGQVLNYRPNVGGVLIPKISYRGLFSLSWAFNTGVAEGTNEIYGNTRYHDFRFTFPYKQFTVDAHYSQFSGFYLENTNSITGTTDRLIRPDLYARSAGVSFTWVWDPDTFSMPHLIGQSERQEKSGGSWLFGGALHFARFRADRSLVPQNAQAQFNWLNEINSTRFQTLSAKGGYGYTLGRKWFVGGYFMAGPGLTRQILQFESDREERDLRGSVRSEILLAGGYNGDVFFTSFRVQNHQEHYTLDDSRSNVRISNTTGGIIDRGSAGRYWSSSQINNTQGRYLSFNSSSCSMLDTFKATGSTARCISE